MKNILVTLLLINSISIFANNNEKFSKAANLYSQNDFAKAKTIYKEILDSGLENYRVYYNLGLVNYRLNNIGKSIFYFKKAQRLNPSDEDTKYNLNFVTTKIENRISYPQNILHKFVDKYVPFNNKKILFIQLFLSLLLLVIYIIPKLKRNKLFKNTIIAANMFNCIILVFVLNLNYKFGVISSDVASVYSGKGVDNIVLFELNEGSDVKVLKKDLKWSLIKIAKNKKGWIENTKLIQ